MWIRYEDASSLVQSTKACTYSDASNKCFQAPESSLVYDFFDFFVISVLHGKRFPKRTRNYYESSQEVKKKSDYLELRNGCTQHASYFHVNTAHNATFCR